MMKPNEATMRLLLDFEVGGGRAYYDRVLRFPTWPGASSGVTIGVGYDLGYNEASTIRGDWNGHIPAGRLNRLAQCAGVTGTRARRLVPSVNDIEVQWEAGFAVFQAVSIPKFWRQTQAVFPGVDQLHPNCQGALLSLVFNRGGSLSGERRREMRAVRERVPQGDYRGIAEQIRAMKRLWIGTDIEAGMARRRDAEADLVLASVSALDPVEVWVNNVRSNIPGLFIAERTYVGVRALVEALGGAITGFTRQPLVIRVTVDGVEHPFPGREFDDVRYVRFADLNEVYRREFTFTSVGGMRRLSIR
jgi:hypothetical protein